MSEQVSEVAICRTLGVRGSLGRWVPSSRGVARASEVSVREVAEVCRVVLELANRRALGVHGAIRADDHWSDVAEDENSAREQR